jgi:hypothetical protein
MESKILREIKVLTKAIDDAFYQCLGDIKNDDRIKIGGILGELRFMIKKIELENDKQFGVKDIRNAESSVEDSETLEDDYGTKL